MTTSLTRDDFEDWLFDMDDELEALLAAVPVHLSERLDFGLESLKALEAHLLERYADIASIKVESEWRAFDRYLRYVGETVRRTAGGRWDIDLDRPGNVYYRMPVIVGPRYGPVCPVTLVTASLDRRRGDYLYGVAKAQVARAGAG